ncbi:pentapeptide repeat-containing protein [Amycolatopsis samaneae]
MLSTRTILLWGAGLLVLATTAAITLLSTLGGGRPEDSARLDALRTAANVVVGTGGAAALLLAARRQRSAELDLVQKDHDATQRRVTEMYSKAAEQLGSDKAPVRLAGLYALERLAQEHEEQRQTIVNVLCAYLRMPFEHVLDEHERSEENRQELQVRKAAQRILMLHLGPAAEGSFWPGTDLDLSDASLVDFTLTRCRIRSVVFDRAKFAGVTEFSGAVFLSKASFEGANFTDYVDFSSVGFPTLVAGQFPPATDFSDATFSGEVDFSSTDAHLSGAMARTDRPVPGVWPPGWIERPLGTGAVWSGVFRHDG